MLTRFLTCPARFSCLVVDGLKAEGGFNARIEYGNLWHAAEEAHSRYGSNEGMTAAAVYGYAKQLIRRFPTDVDQINQWTQLCLTQFSVYLDHWGQHKDAARTIPLLQEQVFKVPYTLPSGRAVYLRGKWDGVVLVESGPNKGVWLREHKTKSRIDPVKMQRHLTFDLQTMLYLVALTEYRNTETVLDGIWNKCLIKGVRYNVVRRSEHRYTQKDMTLANFCSRVGGLMRESPDEWFMRWDVAVRPGDVKRFKETCLDPLLERLCCWWELASGVPLDDVRIPLSCLHWRHPFGSVNWVDEAGETELDEYLDSGSTVGLRKVTNLFPELQEDVG